MSLTCRSVLCAVLSVALPSRSADVLAAGFAPPPLEPAAASPPPLAPTVPWAAPAASPAPAPRPTGAALLEDPQIDPRARSILGRYASFLHHLPVERLAEVSAHADGFELVFDLAGADETTVTLAAHAYCAVETDPDTGVERLVRRHTSEHELVVHARVRFYVTGEEIAGLRAGDLEVRKGPFDLDLDLRTETDRGRVARDERGRVLVVTGEDGEPLREGRRYVPRRFDHWVVLSTSFGGGRIGVDPPAAPAR